MLTFTSSISEKIKQQSKQYFHILKYYIKGDPVPTQDDGPLCIDSTTPQHQPHTAANINASLNQWTNKIRTTQYTWWNFIVLNIGGQLLMPYNFYFLMLSFLQLFPTLSDSGGSPTYLIPLSLVVGFAAVRDAHEDIQRHKADQEENTKKCTAYREGKPLRIDWGDVYPGDIIRIHKDELIPADIILLHTADRFQVAYIETKDLDGETNLKTKLALNEISDVMRKKRHTGSFKAQVYCKPPNADLNSFEASMIIKTEEPSTGDPLNTPSNPSTKHQIGFSQFVHRGAVLKNTDWIYGFVVYTGLQTKIFKNLKAKSVKHTTLLISFKKQVVVLILLQVLLCLVASISGALRDESFQGVAWYLMMSDVYTIGTLFTTGALNFLRYILLLSYLVPISLLVQLQICRFFQGLAISRDRQMLSTNQTFAAVHSSSIVEELGCVSHIFSDKTGTLTENSMKFRCFTIGEMSFGMNEEELHGSPSLDENYKSEFVNFNHSNFLQMVKTCTDPVMRHQIGLFMLCLSICHSVVSVTDCKSSDTEEESRPPPPPESAESPTSSTGVFDSTSKVCGASAAVDASYDACSPDELALVGATKQLGLQFVGRPNLSCIQLQIVEPLWEDLLLTAEEAAHVQRLRMKGGGGALLTFEVLKIIEFDNVRKMMSVLIRGRDGRLLLLAKGADSSMFAVAAKGQEAMLATTKRDLIRIAGSGLRTLVFGYRVVEEEEFAAYEEFRRSDSMMGDEELKHLAASKMMEHDLTILGCTGVEDRLQSEVPQTVQYLRDAGINLWVLTGDKLETAVSVGYSTSVLNDVTYNAVVDGTSVKAVQEQLLSHMYCVVAAQLAGDFFNTFYEVDDDSPMSSTQGNAEMTANMRSCGTCIPSGLFFNRCNWVEEDTNIQPKKARKSIARPTMAVDDFVRILKYAVKRKSVIVSPEQRDPKTLTERQLSRVVKNYVDEFDPRAKHFKKAEITSGDHHFDTERLNVNSEEAVEGFKMCALIITGEALQHILSSEVCKRYMFALTNVCSTVIACRMSPKQKGDLILQAKKYMKRMVSLAVGDGANDVGMLVSANVGVAIQSKEGYQAARAADFVIGEFRFLRNLLFYHGKEGLRRNKIHVYHTIWKNSVFGSSSFFCGFASAFSASEVFNSWLKQLFNLLFTTLPMVWYGVFDLHLSYNILMKSPLLYQEGGGAARAQKEYRYFFRWLAYGLYGALIATLTPYIIFQPDGIDANFSATSYGTIVFEIIVLACNMAIIPLVNNWNIGLILCIIFDLFCFYLSHYVCVSLPVDMCYELKETIYITHKQLLPYMVLLISVCAVLIPQVYLWFHKSAIRPTLCALTLNMERLRGDSQIMMRPKQNRLVAIVKKRETNVHKGFAFSEQEAGLHPHRQSSQVV